MSYVNATTGIDMYIPSAWISCWTLRHLRQSFAVPVFWPASWSRTSGKHLYLQRSERLPSEREGGERGRGKEEHNTM